MISLRKTEVKVSLKAAFGYCILAAVLLLSSCSSSRHHSSKGEENQGWEIVKTDKSDDPSWVISKRKFPGSNFREYKIEGEVKSSPKACISVFKQDIYQQADDPKNKKYPTYKITKESEECLLTYVIHNEPFPLKDTEMSVRYKFFNDEEGGTGVRWHEAWEDCPVQPSKKLNRVQTFRGSLICSPTDDNSAQAVKSVQFDPLKMPMWLVEPMVNKFLKKGLEDLREQTSKPELAI